MVGWALADNMRTELVEDALKTALAHRAPEEGVIFWPARGQETPIPASGRPTMVKPGSPLDTWTSTETGRPTAPMRVAVAIEASMPRNGRAQFESATATFRFSGDETPAIRTVACTRSCRSEFARNSRFRGEHPSGSTLQTPRGPATPRQGLGKHARSLSQSTGNTSEAALSDRASTRSTSTEPC